MFVVQQTETFQKWLDDVDDPKAQVRIAARIRQVSLGNLGDWKSLGEGISELRVDYGPGYRLYFTRRKRVVILLLVGGAKGTQTRDIARAKQLASTTETT